MEIIKELRKGHLRRKKQRENRRSRVKDSGKEEANSCSPAQRANNRPSLMDGNTFIHNRYESCQGNFTLSNKSIVTFEESNQSIA